MNILEFIKEQYPVQDKVRARLTDPYKEIELRDDLPYDSIGLDDSGRLVKMVEINDERSVSVLDILAWDERYVEYLGDKELLSVWKAYMDNLIILDINVEDIQRSIKSYKEMSSKRKEQLDVLSVQTE